MRFRDILVLLGIGLAGYFMLKYIKAEAKPVEKPAEKPAEETVTEEQKTIQSIRTQYETEQIKTQEQRKTQEQKEAEAWRQYTEHQIACETLYDDFRQNCLAYGGSVVDSESLHLLSSSYNVINEQIICDKKYYCVIITSSVYEEQKRYGRPSIRPQPYYEV